MPTGADIVRSAEKYLGVEEKPRNSNRQQFGAWYGMNSVAWCAIFTAKVLADVDIDVRHLVTPGWSSCEMGLSGFRAKHWTVPDSAAQPGDVVFFQFDRDAAADHTGIITSTAGGTLRTIEGNTGVGNDTNGGEVMRRTRAWSLVKGIGRIPGLGQAATATIPAPASKPAAHPNPEAAPLPPPPPPVSEEDDDVKNYLYRSSDGGIWLVENGMRRRKINAPHNVGKLVYLGVANNAMDSKGEVTVPTDDEFLSDIPVGF